MVFLKMANSCLNSCLEVVFSISPYSHRLVGCLATSKTTVLVNFINIASSRGGRGRRKAMQKQILQQNDLTGPLKLQIDVIEFEM